MKYIRMNWPVPYYNMAFEEYLMARMPKDDYLFFYIHDPSIIIGKHQNTIEEVNKEFVDANKIYIARRLSGGGAVYHDEGNLNFSFVMRAKAGDVNNFAKFTAPIIKALGRIGIQAELSGRNDILIDGKKISGNAQFFRGNTILHHGTLLFDSKIENLSSALNVKDIKIQSKGIKSVKSRVTNIKDYLRQDISILEFKEFLIGYLDETYGLEEYVLSETDLAAIEEAVKNKFSTWEWNWGYSPAFNIQKADQFPCGIIDARFQVKDGLISGCKFYGDFFVRRDIETLEEQLKGMPYRNDALLELFKSIEVGDYFNQVNAEELASFLCDQ